MPEVAQLDRIAEEAVKGLALPALNEELTKRSERMEWLFEKGGQNYDLSADEAAEIKSLNDELALLNGAREQKADYRRMREAAAAELARQRSDGAPIVHPAPGTAGAAAAAEEKSLGQLFVESEEFKAGRRLSSPGGQFEAKGILVAGGFKATVTTAAGWAPQNIRTGRVVDFAVRRPMVADLIPQDPTDQAAVVYMEETTFTNNAAPVAENAAKPESALAWTQRTQPVEVIAHLIPITRQQLDDVPQVRSVVDNRLVMMLALAEESQLLTGDGNTPNLLGFLNKPNILTQAKGADPTPDAVYKLFTKIRATGFAEPSASVWHPNDWQDVRLLRTADGIYIWGPPSEAGPETIWGKPIVQTTAETENTVLAGDFPLYSHISRRMGVVVEMATQHSTDFAFNRVTLRAEERLSLEIYRATAFGLCTGV